MARFQAQSGAIYFEQRGARANPRVLFIHGLGCQIVQWPDSLIDGVVAASLCAVTFDNRDAGLSDGSDLPPPPLTALIAADGDPGPPAPAYTLADMARDTIDLLDHLGQSGAHVVGVSMGGMIGQRLALDYPERVFSLTCIMSSTGNPGLPRATDEALGALMATMVREDPEAAAASRVHAASVLAGPHFDSQALGMARFVDRAMARGYHPEGTVRQLAALLAGGDRRAALAKLAVPTLVIHGNADPLIPVAAGQELAATIPGAQYVEIDKLGHDLPEPVIAELVTAITTHIHNVEVHR